jgi:membrane-associated phospholipid phosphatase
MASTKKKRIFHKTISKFFRGGLLWFTIPFLVFILLGAFLNLVLKRGDIVIAINSVSNEWLDKVFLLVTTAGLGSFIAIIGVLLAFYRFRWSLLVFVDLAWTGIFTNVFKRIFFVQLPRPMHYFLYDDFPRFLYDAPLTFFNTFPSGHTITIYAFCSLMAFLFDKKFLGILFFVFAFVVGVSRIYLLQHFFIDTYFGAILGIVSTILTLWIDEKFRFGQKEVLDKNFIILFFRRKKIAG